MIAPLICNACGKVYLFGDDDGLCDDPSCRGAVLDPLLGFVSYRRRYKTHRGVEENDLGVRVKDRIEKVLHSRRLHGGFFIDKTGIEREDFEQKIATTLLACKKRVMILILTPGALDPRDNADEDWMRKEIALAIQHGLEIIPNGYPFDTRKFCWTVFAKTHTFAHRKTWSPAQLNASSRLWECRGARPIFGSRGQRASKGYPFYSNQGNEISPRH